MPAPKKSNKWGNPTNKKKYTPQEVWDKACRYFEWCDQNPWIKMQPKKGNPTIPAHFEGDTTQLLQLLSPTVPVPTTRPYTIEGLCNHMDITCQTFENYARQPGYEDYFDTCTRVKQIINTQHFEGGMVGAFNANIVTRKLGLAERQELTGRDGKDLVQTLILKMDTSAKQTFADNEQNQDNTTQTTIIF